MVNLFVPSPQKINTALKEGGVLHPQNSSLYYSDRRRRPSPALAGAGGNAALLFLFFCAFSAHKAPPRGSERSRAAVKQILSNPVREAQSPSISSSVREKAGIKYFMK